MIFDGLRRRLQEKLKLTTNETKTNMIDDYKNPSTKKGHFVEFTNGATDGGLERWEG